MTFVLAILWHNYMHGLDAEKMLPFSLTEYVVGIPEDAWTLLAGMGRHSAEDVRRPDGKILAWLATAGWQRGVYYCDTVRSMLIQFDHEVCLA